MPQVVAPYGSWKSPIASDVVAQKSLRLGPPVVADDTVYWCESRPEEAGRHVIVRLNGGEAEDVSPLPFNARSRAGEYGGGEFLVAGGVIYFSNFSDQQLYALRPGERPRPLTAPGPWRYADGVADLDRGRIVCVREDHSLDTHDPAITIVAINLASGAQQTLVQGADFYSNPRLSPDGKTLCWIEWRHPNMPWDGTELRLAAVRADGTLADAELAAGGPEESIVQPEWSPGGRLHFLSDRSGWWNFYRWRNGAVEPILQMEAEFGYPRWVFGMSSYDFESEDALVCACGRPDGWRLHRLRLPNGALEKLPGDATETTGVRVQGQKAYFLGGSAGTPEALSELDLKTGRTIVLRSSAQVEAALTPYLTEPRAIEFSTTGGATAHAWYYPPSNPDFRDAPDRRPPLIVWSHGGPTAQAGSTLDLRKQYWTSRGFALVDVNYGGSSGYGRAYRERLAGQWGVTDVDDCCNAALYLADQGLADRNRLLIRGGSAGGFTTLAALAFRDIFCAGASYYGVSDLESFVGETHKFEARYLDKLVGPYPERESLYRERSPVRHPEAFSAPVIFFQGDEGRIVPPEQSAKMAAALRKKGVPAAYLLFVGEQHGFRGADAVRRALDAELYFYAMVALGVELRF